MITVSDYRDFLADLEDKSVDLVLTDPPYNISRETGFKDFDKGLERFAVSMDFGEWDKEVIDLEVMASEFYRVLRKGGTAIVFYDIWKLETLKNALEKAGFKMLRQIIWQKTNPVPLNSKATYLSNSREMAISAVKVGKPTFNGSYDNGIYRYPIPQPRNHPTMKPLGLFMNWSLNTAMMMI